VTGPNESPNGVPIPASVAALVEAVLLVGPRPVSAKALASATRRSEDEVRLALVELGRKYSPSYSGVVLREVAGGHLLATNPLCAGAIERFREEARPAPLSGAALEVLACVLYLGPTTRSTVSRTRGVNSDAVVRNLLDRGLLAERGREREGGGTANNGGGALLDVTEDFLFATGASGREDFAPVEDLVPPEDLARLRERLGEPPGEPSERGD
jgi:segregation and condensation protein B